MAEKSKSSYFLLQVIFVIVVLFTVVVSTGAIAVSADSTDVDRGINQSEISPGETTNVTLQITAPNNDPAILEEFNGSVGNVSIQETTPEPVAKGIGDDNTGVTAVWEDTTNATIEYELAAPTNASDGDSIEITGEAGQSVIKIQEDDEKKEPFFSIEISDTSSPIEAGESLEVTAQIENEGNVSGTQTVDLNLLGLGGDSASVSLDSGDSQIETFSVPTSDSDAGDYTVEIETNNDSDATPVSVDEAESSGGGGSGGGVGGGDDPELSVDIFDFESSTTIRLADIPRASEADIDTEASIVGDTFTVSSIWIDFRFNPDDFRIEASDPRADAGSAPSLPSDVAEPFGYVELEFIGADESTVTDTQIAVQVNNETLSESESRENLQMYQYISGEWTSLETELDGDTAITTVQNITEEQFVLGIERSEQTDPEDEQEDQPEDDTADEAEDEQEDQPEDDTADEAEDDAADEVEDDASEETEEIEDDIPGFGVPIAIITLTATVLIVARRRLASEFVTF